MVSDNPGKIIILNGASSSGKTTILRAVQNLMDEPYLDAGIDRFIWMLPKRYLNRPLWDDVLGQATQAGAAGQRLFRGMHRAIRELALCGNNVLADHVLVEPDWVEQCASLFCDLPAYLVGVRCPLDVLEQRERSRKDRTLGQAKAQFPLVHKVAVYDLELDTSLLSVETCAFEIKRRLENGVPPAALRILSQKKS